MRFVWDEDMYIVKYAFHGTKLGFSRNWREAGANFQKSEGTDLDLIPAEDDVGKYLKAWPPLAELKELRGG
jgi:hypothetical protein